MADEPQGMKEHIAFLRRELAELDRQHARASFQPSRCENVTPQQFEQAFAAFRERVPGAKIEERWSAILPDLDPQEFPRLKAMCEEIVSMAIALAQEHRTATPESPAPQALGEIYPFLTEERLRDLTSYGLFVTR
jgi:hypothetical protein